MNVSASVKNVILDSIRFFQNIISSMTFYF